VRKGVIASLLVTGIAVLVSPPSFARQARAPKKAAADRTDRYQVPAGTALLLKLKTPVDSGKASVDDQVEATFWSPVIQDGVELIPAGSVAIGKVVGVKRATERVLTGSVAFAFSIVEHAETGSRAMMTTRKVLVEAPVPDGAARGKSKPKPVQATMSEGAPFIAMTAEPLLVRIPR
jgi:hypothetical protein